MMALPDVWEDEALFMDTKRAQEALTTGNAKKTSVLGNILSIFGAAPKAELADKEYSSDQQASNYKFLDPFDETVLSGFQEDSFEEAGITFVIIKNVGSAIDDQFTKLSR